MNLDDEIRKANTEYVIWLRIASWLGQHHNEVKDVVKREKIYLDELKEKKKRQLQKELHQAE